MTDAYDSKLLKKNKKTAESESKEIVFGFCERIGLLETQYVVDDLLAKVQSSLTTRDQIIARYREALIRARESLRLVPMDSDANLEEAERIIEEALDKSEKG